MCVHTYTHKRRYIYPYIHTEKEITIYNIDIQCLYKLKLYLYHVLVL